VTIDPSVLHPPTDEALERAAKCVLGETASEATLAAGGKIFRGMGGFFLQGPDEVIGESITHASDELKASLMREAARVDAFRREVERARHSDPDQNPMIKPE
jgi:hypothetical protein